jgi:hypothetical protein
MKLEADFTEFYGADIRDLWRPESDMTVRWVISHMINLPDRSRVMQSLRNDPLTVDQHLMFSIMDALHKVGYFSSVAALAQIDKKDRKGIIKGVPKDVDRPKVHEEKTEKKRNFASAKDLKAMGIFGG